MAAHRDLLVKKIKDLTGMTLSEFCEKYLFSQYNSFKYRRKHKQYYPNEVIFISWFMGESVEDLFGMDFTELMLHQGNQEVGQGIRKMLLEATPDKRDQYFRLLSSSWKGTAPKEKKVEKEIVVNEPGLAKVKVEKVQVPKRQVPQSQANGIARPEPKPAPKGNGRGLDDVFEDVGIISR